MFNVDVLYPESRWTRNERGKKRGALRSNPSWHLRGNQEFEGMRERRKRKISGQSVHFFHGPHTSPKEAREPTKITP